GANFPQSDLPALHVAVLLPVNRAGWQLVASYRLATNFAQIIANCGKGPQLKSVGITACFLALQMTATKVDRVKLP
ncbi:hypothetical protein, partial [Roseiarcus sp.]|uniref:hypothetical protein n=1 Tax=Roseiarcus sp. TaxID=1969460 RepID=UPI003F9E60FA